MSFINSLNISASGMSAQKLRLDVAAENIANQETTRTENGGPYRRKMVVLQAAEDNSFRKAMLLHRPGPPVSGRYRSLMTQHSSILFMIRHIRMRMQMAMSRCRMWIW